MYTFDAANLTNLLMSMPLFLSQRLMTTPTHQLLDHLEQGRPPGMRVVGLLQYSRTEMWRMTRRFS